MGDWTQTRKLWIGEGSIREMMKAGSCLQACCRMIGGCFTIILEPFAQSGKEFKW